MKNKNVRKKHPSKKNGKRDNKVTNAGYQVHPEREDVYDNSENKSGTALENVYEDRITNKETRERDFLNYRTPDLDPEIPAVELDEETQKIGSEDGIRSVDTELPEPEEESDSTK